MDNCSAQGKNWYIYTALTTFINCGASNLEGIKLKYFEKGHTFMPAGIYHQMVEKSLKELKKVYDFENWKMALNHHGRALVLAGKDCIKFPRGLSQRKHITDRPTIERIVEANFREGSPQLFWKEGLNDTACKSAEFLKKYIFCQLSRRR